MTIYAITTIFTFILALSAIFYSAVGVRKRQLKTMPEIKEIYEKYLSSKYEIYAAEVEKRRDKTPPTAEISIDLYAVKVNQAISVTITQSDNKDRLDFDKCSYVCNNSNSDVANAYTSGKLSQATNNISLTFQTPGIYFVHALIYDLDQNSTEIVSSGIIATN